MKPNHPTSKPQGVWKMICGSGVCVKYGLKSGIKEYISLKHMIFKNWGNWECA